MKEEVTQYLPGGMGNRGQVVRIGNTVRRPPGPHSASVTSLLDHLAASGFEGAPSVLGEDAEGRDVYEWIDGDVPVPPYPGWAQSDAALVSTARLVRRLHDALAAFESPPEASWSEELADPHGGPLICHNDFCPENVVFREQKAIAILDFDFAAPGRPIWDLASAAYMWVPLRPPSADDVRDAATRAGRLARFAAGYGLARTEHEMFIEAIIERQDVGSAFVRRRVDAGEPAFVEMWRQRGGAEGFEDVAAWMKSQRGTWLQALQA